MLHILLGGLGGVGGPWCLGGSGSMISPDDLRIPEGMKGPGSPKYHGFLGSTRGLWGLVFLEDQGGPEDSGGMSMKFKLIFILDSDDDPQSNFGLFCTYFFFRKCCTV